MVSGPRLGPREKQNTNDKPPEQTSYVTGNNYPFPPERTERQCQRKFMKKTKQTRIMKFRLPKKNPRLRLHWSQDLVVLSYLHHSSVTDEYFFVNFFFFPSFPPFFFSCQPECNSQSTIDCERKSLNHFFFYQTWRPLFGRV